MTPEMKKFIELLENELGYAEKASAYTKFGSWYGKNIEFDADYTHAPWCDMFLSWAAHKLGYEEWMGQFAWTVAHAKWFKKQDAWGTKPEPGAFVFYDWSGSNSIGRIDHVGIVTRVEGGRIFTIEGNIDGGVAKRKERDTSKVVGYGYPWKIKERLDAKKSMREGHYAADHPGSHKPGTLQLPEQFRPEIPFLETEEQAKVPLAAPKSTAKKKTGQAEAPAPKPSPKTAAKEAAPAPVSGTASSPAVPKSGKHAKHSAADTSAVTTGPIPVITDVAVSTPPPAAVLGSPAILTSALVATLAMLAITKTKRLRLRPALAAAPAPAPAHRRRRRKSAGRVVAAERPPRRNAVELTGPHRPLLDGPLLDRPLLDGPVLYGPLLDAAEPVGALRSLQETVVPAFETIVIPEATSAFNAFSRSGSSSGSPRTPATTGPVELFPRRLDATGPIRPYVRRTTNTTEPATAARRFEPFPLAPQAPARPESRTGHTTSGFEPFPHPRHEASAFEPFSRTRPAPTGGEPRTLYATSSGEPSPHTRHATSSSEPFHSRHAGSGFEAFSRTPGAASGFDAFTPNAASSRAGASGSTPRRERPSGTTGSAARREHPSGAYSGRRRGREHPAEDLTGFATDASPRGRRHRPSAVDRQFTEPFTQDTPLPGRRHRSISPTLSRPTHLTGPATSRPTHLTDSTMAMAGAPLSETWPLPSEDAPSPAPQHPRSQPPAHGARRPGSRRGRHRA